MPTPTKTVTPSSPATAPVTAVRYLEPTSLDARLNRAVAWLTRRGLSMWGSRELAVRGRTSGEWRTTPVNPLDLDGDRYLVSPRGETQWVRNLRVALTGELRVGRRTDAFTAAEVADRDKPAIIRAYLSRWKFEVGRFFDGIDEHSTDAELLAAASGFPVFRIAPR